jgi:hypothetical protein
MAIALVQGLAGGVAVSVSPKRVFASPEMVLKMAPCPELETVTAEVESLIVMASAPERRTTMNGAMATSIATAAPASSLALKTHF